MTNLKNNWRPGQKYTADAANAVASQVNDHEEFIVSIGEQIATDVADAVTEADIPSQVGAALTAEDIPAQVTTAVEGVGIADLVADAVDVDVAGRDLLLRSDPGVPYPVEAVSNYVKRDIGQNGELILGYAPDGTVEMTTAKTAGLRMVSTQTEGASWALVGVAPDGTRYLTEMCIDYSGNFPPWVVNRLKSRMAGATNPYDIWVFAGQSNATQFGTLTDVIEAALGDVLEWNGTTFAPAQGVPWLGSGFARTFAERYSRLQQRKVAIVKTAVGSTGFSTLNPGTWDRTVTTGATAYLYPASIAAAQAALAAAPAGSRIAGFVWSQGEGDSGVGLATYQAKLDDLIAQTRIDLGIPDLPFIISSLTPDIIAYGLPNAGDTGGASINAILMDTPRRVQRTAFIAGPKGMADPVGNGIHWLPQGQTLRGKWMAERGYDCARLNTAAAAPLPPQNIRITRSGDTVVTEWDHAPCRATSITMSYSTNYGSSWSTATLSAAITLSHTQTVTAGLPFWVRLATVNSDGNGGGGLTSLTAEVHA